MRPIQVARRQPRLRLGLPGAAPTRRLCICSCTPQSPYTTSSRSRPSLPFLSAPKTNPVIIRSYTSERGQWLKHEAKLVARYTVTLWGLAASVLLIFFAINEETTEREHPTPHEWNYLTRKYLRDAHCLADPVKGQINWARCLELTRGVVIRLEDAKLGGEKVVKLSDKMDPSLEMPGEFIHCDISAMSEEWRRGYFEAIMLAARAAEHVDGWVRDRTRNVVCAPEFVIGPSNPRPKPIPAGGPHAPREEDVDVAYPSADRWYVKILATRGFTSRQRMEAALEYASFLDYKNRHQDAEALCRVALEEASSGLAEAERPYDPTTFIVKSNATAPSMNILDSLTAIANHKAHRGDVTFALPAYVSLLKARRSLSDTPPPQPRSPRSRSERPSLYQQLTALLGPPAYPPPGPDGRQAPWRDPLERCQEASLHLYIGEILYATASRDDGLAWTRDGVDLAEQQLRALDPANKDKDKETKRLCRECLSTGLDNWSTMVSRLAKTEKANKTSSSSHTGGMFSFWGSPTDVQGRWAAEEAVVEERVRRTRELLEDVAPPAAGIMSYLKA